MKKSTIKCFVIGLMGFFLGGLTVTAAPKDEFHLIKKFTLGGDGGWDYITLDSATRRLYISRSTRVMVMNVDTGTLVGEIPNTPGVHGVAIVPELGKGFTSNGRENVSSIFDLKTLKVLGQAKDEGDHQEKQSHVS